MSFLTTGCFREIVQQWWVLAIFFYRRHFLSYPTFAPRWTVAIVDATSVSQRGRAHFQWRKRGQTDNAYLAVFHMLAKNLSWSQMGSIACTSL